MISTIKKALLFFIAVSVLLIAINPGWAALFLPLSILGYAAAYMAGKFLKSDATPVAASASPPAPGPKIKAGTGAQPRATVTVKTPTERVISGGTRSQWGANEALYSNAIAHYKSKLAQAVSEQQKLHAESMILASEVFQRQKFHMLDVFDHGVENFDTTRLTKMEGKDVFDYGGELPKALEQLHETATADQLFVCRQNFDRLKFLYSEFMQIYPLPSRLG